MFLKYITKLQSTVFIIVKEETVNTPKRHWKNSVNKIIWVEIYATVIEPVIINFDGDLLYNTHFLYIFIFYIVFSILILLNKYLGSGLERCTCR